MQKSNSSFIITILIYTIVIGGVLLWSGQDREKNLYDRHLIILQGASFYTTRPIVSRNFYEKIVGLEFKGKHERSDNSTDNSTVANELEFSLPDQRSLNLIPLKEGTLNQVGTILIRVGNNVAGLHDKFEKQLNSFKNRHKDYQFQNAKITPMRKSLRGKEFDLIDPDGNTLTFYQRYFFSRE